MFCISICFEKIYSDYTLFNIAYFFVIVVAEKIVHKFF